MLSAHHRKTWLWLVLFLPLLAYDILADTFSASVANVRLELAGDVYLLSADIDYRLSDAVKEALNNGVPLFWTIEIKMHRPRHILWDKTLFETRLRYRLQYHALLNVYRVVTEDTGRAYNFSTLSTALEFMSNIHGIRILTENELAQEKLLLIELKAEFERNALPLPLRPFVYFKRDWNLSSDWTQTPWTK